MNVKNTPVLRIGDLEVSPPIIQGGMGVRVSRASLASAVANEGCVGVIASAGLGQFENHPESEFAKVNAKALRDEIRKARSLTSGIIGVNIMVALTDYENLVKTAIDEDVDIIISGAGLPLHLPGYLNGKDIKLVPIVSSARALEIICRKWKGQFNKIPDAVIVEGVKAGGHLGYSYEDIINKTTFTLEQIIEGVIEIANSYNPNIPVIAAGGIFNGEDIAHFLGLGASGVQMATRFVCTYECDVHKNFKQAYLDAKAEDITIIPSPVGLPGRVINNSFVEKIKNGETMPFECSYQCLKTCDPRKAPYCIAKVLANAAEGNMDESFAFAGSNAYKCKEIVSVKSLIQQLVQELSSTAYMELMKQNL
ncbi:MAG: 2-nitropropane dioxygenase [Planctomycetes bacterium RBG_13_44_8b]|nr:MAG: 2-nitropropane dioxygenase [Planctomycetes bacterium RBG_13_44_8b]